MNIVVKSIQKYDSHEETVIEKYENAETKWEAGKLIITHANGNMRFDDACGEVEIENLNNKISIKLNEKKVLTYNTPYGKIIIETYGEKLEVEKNKISILFIYRIFLQNGTNYLNSVEITEE